MRTRSSLLAAICAGLLLSGCVAQPRFEWGSYDASLLLFSKKPDQAPVFEKALVSAIARGKASKRLAPGLQAELGYLYLGQGRKQDAVEQFRAEMQSFPESRTFMERAISQAAS